ncbi:MAG: PAS domain S-box protein [Rudaea sp.]
MNLASIFHLSSSLVAVLDAGDGKVVDVNDEFARVLGTPREDLLNRHATELGFWANLETRAEIWAELRSAQRICDKQVVFRCRDGRQLSARLCCERFEYESHHYVLAIFQQVADAAVAETRAITDPGSYRALFMAATEGLYRSLPGGGWIDVNPALARIFGYESSAQMLGATLGKVASDLYADPELAAQRCLQLDRDGKFENERAQIRRADGSTVWISESSRVVRNDRDVALFYEGSVVDISRQIEAEQRLLQSERMYRTLVDNSHDGVFLIHHDGTVGFMNEAMAATLGYTARELIGTSYMRLIAPESLAAQSVRRKERFEGSYAVQSYDVTMLRKDGTARLLHVHAGAVDYEGEVASIGTARDITEEQRQRDALEHAERTYRELFQNSVAGMFRSMPDGRIVAANDAFARILGYTDSQELLDAGRPIDEYYADPHHRRAVLARIAASPKALTFEFEARRCDGITVPAEVRALAVRDGDGNMLWVEGSAQDISARRDAEAALQRSEARYRTLVEHSQVGVYMMHEDRYTYVNHAFATMFGYTEQELVGADFRLLVPPESREHQDARYQRQISGELGRGDYSVVLMRKDGARIEVVVSAGSTEMDGARYTTGTIRDVTEQHRVQRALEHNAMHDLLTGLPNRVFFEQQLAGTIADARERGDHNYAVLFLDLDGFKLVNDSLGHASGDILLVQIAESLRANLGGHCLVARYGGDEFTLLPHGPCPRTRVEQLAQRVLSLLAGSFEIDGHRIFSGASVGVVLGHPDYQTPEQILRDADTAMYRAKASGKSAYVIFDDAMHAAARARLMIETELRFALERGEFRAFYQPIVDLQSGRLLACEALVRWQHPRRGLLMPDEFLSVAEETGTLLALDWWMLEHTCRNLLRWQRRYPAHARLRASVNIDERQFAEPELVNNLRGVLNRTGIDPSALALEITETVFRGGRREAETTLNALKELGVSLVVDDFGTGYSSLDSFATSPFDALKVDRGFIRDMITNPRHGAIVRTIVGFAKDLGLGLIAEGVETHEQATRLLESGCSSAQGFLYSPAVPEEVFESMLESGVAPGQRPESGAVA